MVIHITWNAPIAAAIMNSVPEVNLVPGENRPYREIDVIKTTLYGGFFNKDKEGKKT